MIATTTSLWVGGLYRGPLLVEVEGLIQELNVAATHLETEPISLSIYLLLLIIYIRYTEI